MPELPEVEAVARSLRPLVTGLRIQRCRVLHPIVASSHTGRGAAKGAASLEVHLRDRRILDVTRRGKYLLLLLDRGCIVMHFKLDGQLVWFDTPKITGHIDVAFEFKSSGALGFVDPRHFGRVQWVRAPENLPGICSLGVDPFSNEFTPARLHELLSNSRQPLKMFLLDQKRLAGIGNIYSNEALWHARLNPRRRANRLTAREARRLHNAIVAVLRRALVCCLRPAPDFRDPEWWFRGLEKILRVYGREGKPCNRCGKAIRRITQGGRSSFVCKNCQSSRQCA
ncbi:MAG: DNA-formamidopyrimidine glycosylase [Candidatus Acidiferrales bacterium]